MSKSKQIFIEDRTKREEIPIYFQEDYELESNVQEYLKDLYAEWQYKEEFKLL